MDLWIRSQDKKILKQVKKLYVTTYSETLGFGIYDLNYDDLEDIDDTDVPLGFYKSKERALKVLDDIQHKMTNKYFLVPKEKLTIEEKQQLMDVGQFNPKIDLVSTMEKIELKPINNNIYIYEMPEE